MLLFERDTFYKVGYTTTDQNGGYAFNGLNDNPVGPRGIDADPGAVFLYHFERKSILPTGIGRE